MCHAAQVEGGGQACWLISDTVCDGVLQGNSQTKMPRCLRCDVFNSYDLKHRAEMRRRFLGSASSGSGVRAGPATPVPRPAR